MILERYLMREYLRMFAMIIGGLFAIYFSTRLASFLGEAADGKISPEHIFELLGLKMFIALRDLVPMSLYIGIFAAIIRLQRDSELSAMRAAGAGHTTLMRAAFKLALLSGLFVAVMTLYVQPPTEETVRKIREQTENEATIAGVKAGRFKELRGGRIFYAENISKDDQMMQNAFVGVTKNDKVGLLRADNAFIETNEKTQDRFAVFLDGTTYAGRPGALDYVITHFAKYALRIDPHDPADLSNEITYLPTARLLKYDTQGFRGELQWRIARPMGALLLPLLAVLIAMGSTGDSWYLGLLSAISMYFVYSNLLGVAHAMARRVTFHHSPALGFWAVQLVFACVIGLLFWKQRSPRNFLRFRRG